MDCGTKAFSLPNGTALGCTFNPELVKALFEQMGAEMRRNRVDVLLGPGINIHRSPMNGRNFEYISEDPLVTGKIGAVQLLGMHESGVTGTIKHYAANNQEHYRRTVEAVMSERALREIYLRGYEICVKEGNAKSVMTTYGPINGVQTAGNFDLCTQILRNEWGFTGIVMTDWWAEANWDGEAAEKPNRAPMVRAQNDLYMCCNDVKADMEFDNVKEKLASGDITRYDLQRNAKNILKFAMEMPALLYKLGRIEEEEVADGEEDLQAVRNLKYYDVDAATGILALEKDNLVPVNGEIQLGFTIPKDTDYRFTIEIKSELSELAQLPISLYIDNLYRHTFSFRGTNGECAEQTLDLGLIKTKNHFLKLVMQGNGLEVQKIVVGIKS